MATEGTVEGATRLFPPPGNLGRRLRAPGAREKGQPFFNPGMGLNRDLSVLLAEAVARQKGREIDVADALAGTGARAVRLAHEVEAPLVVHANDAQPEAVAAIRRAAAGNGVEARVHVHEGDAHAFLAARRFDVVDLDPCGSPMPFLDAAVRATRHAGYLCATATDTGALAGAFPRACRRRYDAHHGLHAAAWRSEVGLRILAGAAVRSAARFDRVAVPVLSVSHGHWMRVVVRIQDGKRDADAALKGLANAAWDPATGAGSFVPLDAHPAEGWAGPLWAGPLHETAMVVAMQDAMAGKALAHPEEARKLLAILAGEAEAPAFWLVPDTLRRALGGAVPRRDRLLASLAAMGLMASRSHLDPQGVRTGARGTQLQEAWDAAGASAEIHPSSRQVGPATQKP